MKLQNQKDAMALLAGWLKLLTQFDIRKLLFCMLLLIFCGNAICAAS
jgi:hypothetical protein